MTSATKSKAGEPKAERPALSKRFVARLSSRNPASRIPTFLIPSLVILALAALPYIGLPIPGVLPGAINSPSSMQLLAMCAVVAGIALSYELLFGRTGLMSLGHALFVGVGAYTMAIALSKFGATLPVAVVAVVLVGIFLPLIVGAIALRVKGIAFAMVTMAFAQVAAIVAARNPGGLTNGEDGLGLSAAELPTILVGVLNAPYRFWLAVAFMALAWFTVLFLDRTMLGRSWAAVRENEKRVEVLGISAYRSKLYATVIAGFIATVGGSIVVILTSNASVGYLTIDYSIELVVIVVLGGLGSKYGAVLGAFVYVLLSNRLLEFSSSAAIDQLPAPFALVLSEPNFMIGALFIVIIFFLPGGLSSIPGRLRGRRSRSNK